jgi:hypothetical protein
MEYPRVTEVLRPFSNFQYVPKNILERAAIRGTSVHAICAALAKGAFVPDGMIGEDLLGYVQSFQKWCEIQVESFLVVEKRYQCDDMQFTGQVDYVVLAKDQKLYLADIKTGSQPQKTYPVQMAAYEYLVQKHKIQVEGAMLVYLSKLGDFPDIELFEDLSTERNVFWGALTCWNYFNKKQEKTYKEERRNGRECEERDESI